MPLNCQIFFPTITINPQTFWIKKLMFSSMRKFFVYIELPDWKMHGGGRSLKFQENRSTIIQIKTFIKIGAINSFKSRLLVIRLVSWQMYSVSSNPLRETLASGTSRSPALPRYLPVLQIFKRISSFQYFYGRSCY